MLHKRLQLMHMQNNFQSCFKISINIYHDILRYNVVYFQIHVSYSLCLTYLSNSRIPLTINLFATQQCVSAICLIISKEKSNFPFDNNASYNYTLICHHFVYLCTSCLIPKHLYENLVYYYIINFADRLLYIIYGQTQLLPNLTTDQMFESHIVISAHVTV